MFADPEKRRGLRAMIEGAVALLALALAWRITEMLAADPHALLVIVRGLLAIIAIGTVGYTMENGIRALKLKLGDAELDADSGQGNAP